MQYNDGFRTGLIGTPEYIAQRIVDYKAAGVGLILGGFLHFQEEVEYFGKRVMPLVRELEARRAELEKIAGDQFKDAERRAAALKDFKLEITAKAGTEGKLFGSIGTADIAEAATKAGHKLARAEVRLPTGPLRTVGEHTVALHLHTDIDVQLPVVITAEDARLKTEE